jgi:protein phosphatase
MATTFTGLFVARDGGVLLAHTGDSRAYLLRDGQLTQQSRDDSFVQALVDQGLMSPEEAVSHPRRNLITASLSGAERDVATVTEHAALRGDRWLLCSDGLTDYVPDEAIHAALAGYGDPSDAARACGVLALEAGTRDNVTVVVCDVEPSSGSVVARTHPVFYGAAADRFMEGLEGDRAVGDTADREALS